MIKVLKSHDSKMVSVLLLISMGIMFFCFKGLFFLSDVTNVNDAYWVKNPMDRYGGCYALGHIMYRQVSFVWKFLFPLVFLALGIGVIHGLFSVKRKKITLMFSSILTLIIGLLGGIMLIIEKVPFLFVKVGKFDLFMMGEKIPSYMKFDTRYLWHDVNYFSRHMIWIVLLIAIGVLGILLVRRMEEGTEETGDSFAIFVVIVLFVGIRNVFFFFTNSGRGIHELGLTNKDTIDVYFQTRDMLRPSIYLFCFFIVGLLVMAVILLLRKRVGFVVGASIGIGLSALGNILLILLCVPSISQFQANQKPGKYEFFFDFLNYDHVLRNQISLVVFEMMLVGVITGLLYQKITPKVGYFACVIFAAAGTVFMTIVSDTLYIPLQIGVASFLILMGGVIYIGTRKSK